MRSTKKFNMLIMFISDNSEQKYIRDIVVMKIQIKVCKIWGYTQLNFKSLIKRRIKIILRQITSEQNTN